MSPEEFKALRSAVEKEGQRRDSEDFKSEKASSFSTKRGAFNFLFDVMQYGSVTSSEYDAFLDALLAKIDARDKHTAENAMIKLIDTARQLQPIYDEIYDYPKDSPEYRTGDRKAKSLESSVKTGFDQWWAKYGQDKKPTKRR